MTPTTKPTRTRILLAGLLALALAIPAFNAWSATTSKTVPAATAAKSAVTAATPSKPVSDKPIVPQKVTPGAKAVLGATTGEYVCFKCDATFRATEAKPLPAPVVGECKVHTWGTPTKVEEYTHQCQKCSQKVDNTSKTPPAANANTGANLYCPSAPHKLVAENVANNAKYDLYFKCTKCNYKYSLYSNDVKGTPPKDKPAGTSCGSNHNYVFDYGYASFKCEKCSKTERVTFKSQSSTPPPPNLAANCNYSAPQTPNAHTWKTSATGTKSTYTCSACKFSQSTYGSTAPNLKNCTKGGTHDWRYK